METYFYVCPRCGFVYQVPSYWTNHSPEETVEFEHLDLKTKELCSIMNLVLMDDNKNS